MKQALKIVAALCTPLLLSACLLIPGEFDSKLTMMKDGRYSFIYNGQMQLFSGDEKGGMGGRQSYAPYNPESAECSSRTHNETGEVTELDYGYYGSDSTDDDPNDSYRYESRECSEKEIAAKRKDHEDREARRKKDDDEKKAAMGAIFGGAIPGDDESLRKFADQLAKYDGWNKVEYVGDDLFEVEYAISGRFDQNFSFPSLPGATMQFPFVQIIRRAGGELEILTPALAGPGGLFGAMAMKEMPREKMPDMKPISGNFVIETDGEILSNNSEDGYASEGATKTLRWELGEESMFQEGPRTILRLER